VSDPGPLIIPVAVDAMVVNGESNFIRARMDYTKVSEGGDPSPAPFQQDQENFAGEPANHGVYVMWTLPMALRHGTHDEGGQLDFPWAPNRWGVVRVYRASGGGTPLTSAWVVQSDALEQPDGCPFLDPRQSTPTQVLLGHKQPISIDSPWQEPSSGSPPFLKAIAESNPAFAAYQPANQNVFSIHDDLATQGVGAGTLSYFVIGWYSDPDADVLAEWKDFPELLRSLGWSASAQAEGTHTSVYSGAACGVQWEPTGPVPSSPMDNAQPTVAVGNTSADTVVGFAAAAVEAAKSPPGGLSPQQAADLLQAFQYNLLDLLGSAGAEQVLQERISAQWFGSRPAQTTWTIVDAEADPTAAPVLPEAPAELTKEASWLTLLNTTQGAFDEAASLLLTVRRRLVELLWKQLAAAAYYEQTASWPWGISGEDALHEELETVAGRARKLLDTLATLAPQLPIPTPGATLEKAISKYAEERGLPHTRVLKPQAGSRYWAAGDPTITIAGSMSGMSIDPAETLVTRWPGELATQLQLSAAAAQGPSFSVSAVQLAPHVPAVPWSGLPVVSQALFDEFFLLDPDNASLLQSAAGQTLSTIQLEAAQRSMTPPQPSKGCGIAPGVTPRFPAPQPWEPLYCDWEVEWFEIPFQQRSGTANWAFDGSDYELESSFGEVSTPTPVLGRSVVTPKPSFEFKARIDQFVADNPGGASAKQIQAIEGLLESVDGWDFLSQTLTGFATTLSLWSPSALQNPDASKRVFADSPYTMADLVGDAIEVPPQSLQASGQGQPGRSPFQGIRAGQMMFKRLALVDRFGQTLEVVTSQTSDTFHPLRADGVMPEHTVLATEPNRFVQLPPRLLQPARLNFQFAIPSTSANPILGWVLPNHLDRGLSVYGTGGVAYGELRPAADTAGKSFVNWQQAPASPYPDLASLTKSEPQLGGFLTQLVAAGADSFAAFVAAVDETLWTVDPLGDRSDAYLSVLLGRPLALVAATMSMELESEVLCDPSWPYTFDPPAARLLEYSFPVRLGDIQYGQDGLLGYFLDGDYTHFNTVLTETSDPYLRPVGPGNWVDLKFAAQGPGSARSLALLMDPRAGVRAQCGLLPVKEVTLVPEWVDSSLGAMNVSFRTGPILADEPIAADGSSSLAIPTPAERHGTWSWSEPMGGGKWTKGIALSPADAGAVFPSVAPTLREGAIELSGGLD
jgi:hypothetical protein